ncbi:MAG: hypothetical protein IK132_12255 [Clostridia bacterium]|nr:hypothetical protein [Clostridia bacterium]
MVPFNAFPANYPAMPYGGYFYPNPYAAAQPQPVPQAQPQQTPVSGQTQPAPAYQPQKRTYYPPNWIQNEKELDEYEVQAGNPLFAFVRGGEGEERLVIRTIGEDGRPHDETIPLSFPKEEKVTRKDLEAFATVDNLRTVLGEIKRLSERVENLSEEVAQVPAPQPQTRARKTSAKTWEDDENVTL